MLLEFLADLFLFLLVSVSANLAWESCPVCMWIGLTSPSILLLSTDFLFGGMSPFNADVPHVLCLPVCKERSVKCRHCLSGDSESVKAGK